MSDPEKSWAARTHHHSRDLQRLALGFARWKQNRVCAASANRERDESRFRSPQRSAGRAASPAHAGVERSHGSPSLAGRAVGCLLHPRKQEDQFVMRSDGTRLRQLTEDEYKHRGPKWSPDGKHIGVFSNRSGRYEIWTMNPDGLGLQQVTDFGCDFGPKWSPDGTRFACRKVPEGLPVIVKLGTPSEYTALAQLPKGDFFRVGDWSPDGKTLAGNMDTPAGATGVVLYSLESRKYERITTFGGGTGVAQG